MLVNTINSKRNHNHEYTAVAVQEAARKALGDFMLVAHWDRVDNSEVFFSDGFGHPSDDEFKTQITGLYSLFQLLYAQNGVDLVSVFLAMAVLDDCDVSAEQIDVEVTIDGERINSDPSEVLVTLDSD
ncbi:hypothetical protein [Salinigranum halophilum]|jgi:hypothetical protein|uniref:hypothetical protein n=1 Tax=Salinigranum halophilum TaxID=2565931 RepID=UPI0010A782B1|nr:hypothetical protein [Salinigranum halophilum]